MSLLSAAKLADAPLFAGLAEAARIELADAFVPRHFADGEAIYDVRMAERDYERFITR